MLGKSGAAAAGLGGGGKALVGAEIASLSLKGQAIFAGTTTALAAGACYMAGRDKGDTGLGFEFEKANTVPGVDIDDELEEMESRIQTQVEEEEDDDYYDDYEPLPFSENPITSAMKAEDPEENLEMGVILSSESAQG
jgi:hypothetical protein